MASARDIDDLNRCLHETLIFKLRLTRLDLWSEQLAGIQHLDLGVLAFIEKKPDHTVGEIRDFLEIPHSTMTSLVDRLERRKLVRRTIHQGDKRAYCLELTPEGHEVQREHRRVERRIARKILDALPSEQEQSQFVELFRRIAKAL